MSDIQLKILKGFLESKAFFSFASANLERSYFDDEIGYIVEKAKAHYRKYELIPEYSVLVTEASNDVKLTEEFKEEVEEALDKVKKLDFNPMRNSKWLTEQTELYVTDKAIFQVMMQGVQEAQKPDGERNYASLKLSMEAALSKTWGHDYGLEYLDEESIDDVYAKLADNSIRIPTGVDVIDEAINGGIPGGTKFCAIFVGRAGIGKTLILGNTAINAIKQGKNVLYISFEIDQNELRKRMDAAFADISLNNIIHMKDQVKKKVKQAKQSGSVGRMIIKEYPPASVSALDVENYLYDLKLKKDFTPDVIVLDYLGIMKPIDAKASANSYERGKYICEEIRALSDKFKCPVVSASQSNRSGYSANTVEMDNIADSMAIAHTADLLISLTQNEELKENSQIKFDVIKSRISRNGIGGNVDVDYDRLKLISENENEQGALLTSLTEGISAINSEEKRKSSDYNNDIT